MPGLTFKAGICCKVSQDGSYNLQLAQHVSVCVCLQRPKLRRDFLSVMLLKVGQSPSILQRLRDFFKNRREFLDVGVRRGAICELSVETQVVIHESESLVGCGRNWLHLNLAAKKILPSRHVEYSSSGFVADVK